MLPGGEGVEALANRVLNQLSTHVTHRAINLMMFRQFRNQKHLTAETNASVVKSGLITSNIVSFATIANPPKEHPTNKRRQYIEKFHTEIVFCDCVALWGHQ